MPIDAETIARLREKHAESMCPLIAFLPHYFGEVYDGRTARHVAAELGVTEATARRKLNDCQEAFWKTEAYYGSGRMPRRWFKRGGA